MPAQAQRLHRPFRLVARSTFRRSSCSTPTAQLKTKMLFGSDWPLMSPDRWIKDFREAGFKPEVHDLILKENAIRALKLAAA